MSHFRSNGLQQRLGTFLLIGWSLWLAGCANPDVHTAGHAGFETSGIVRWQDGKALIPRSISLDLESMYQRLARQAKVDAQFRMKADPVPNAYAARKYDALEVTLNAGLLDLIGWDEDALAFVISHELAHISLGHLSSAAGAKARSQTVTSNVLGTVLGAFIPLGALMVDAGHEMIKANFSRDQERDADRVGLEIMYQAGFDPQGAVRFQERLLSVAEDRRMALFASHPPGNERVQNLKALIGKL